MSDNNIKLINITINNREYFVRENTTILKACEENNILNDEIPRFCFHDKLAISGNCRICLVEVEKSPKPVVSCAMPVSKNMVIYTNSPLVRKARESVMESLLINHPLDCPICDQGGECDLQEVSLKFGSDRGRMFFPKRSVNDKETGPIVKSIMTRCIHCTRCIRFITDIAGSETLGAFGRGEVTEIGSYIQSFIKTELSGNLIDLCPVGALTAKPIAYVARTWELTKTDSIDFMDGVCTDIEIHTRKVTSNLGKNIPHKKGANPVKNTSKSLAESVEEAEQILRILPRTNGLIPDNWISDKTRFAFDSFNNKEVRKYSSSIQTLNNLKLVLLNNEIVFAIFHFVLFLSKFNPNSVSLTKPKNFFIFCNKQC